MPQTPNPKRKQRLDQIKLKKQRRIEDKKKQRSDRLAARGNKTIKPLKVQRQKWQKYSTEEREQIKDWMKDKWPIQQIIKPQVIGHGICRVVAAEECTCTKVEKLRELHPTGSCKARSVNYPNPIPNKKPKRLRHHQALWICIKRNIPLGPEPNYKIKSNLRRTISHICGRSLCFTKEHLTEDLHNDNLERYTDCHRDMIQHKETSNPNCQHHPLCFCNHCRN